MTTMCRENARVQGLTVQGYKTLLGRIVGIVDCAHAIGTLAMILRTLFAAIHLYLSQPCSIPVCTLDNR